MGTEQSIILDRHTKLNKQIADNNLKSNFIIFDIPIRFEYCGQTKSYLEQLEESTDEELNNTTYNVLYIPSLNIKITANEVKNVNEFDEENISIIHSIHDNDGNLSTIYKHFTFDDEPVPKELVNHVKKIRSLEQEIKLLEQEILLESNKISNLDYVKRKLKTKPQLVKTYIDMCKDIYKNIYKY